MAANNIYIQVDFNSAAAQQNVNALNQSIANTGPAAEKSSKQATAGMNSIGISIQSVSREFANLSNAIAGLGIAKAVMAMVQISAEMSRTQLAMVAFTGSVEEANKVFEEVRKIAAQSPFRFKDLEETARQLLGFGMAAKNVPDTLRVITDQVGKMGGSIENVNNVVRLFGRIMEKDFVGAMDLMRALPQQGVQVMNALRAELSKSLGRPAAVDDVKAAIKEGLLDPLQTIRTVLDSMRKSGGFGAALADAAVAFKNLADAGANAVSKLFGPDGFGPALTKLANDIGNVLAPLGGLIDYLMKLPESTKETIVQVAAAAAAFAALSVALGLVTNLAGPLLGLTVSIAKFTLSLAAMNPELLITAAVIGGLAFTLYKIIPEFKSMIDNFVGGLVDKVKGVLSGLGEEGKKFFAGIFKGGEAINTDDILNPAALKAKFDALLLEEQKHANEAQRTLLEALVSPVEAVQMKYKTLFAELETKMQFLKEDQKKALHDVLQGAEDAEMAGAAYKEHKKQLDELTRYQVEKSKGATDAQIAYIEAQDAQDLRGKVRAIDQVTKLRIEGAEQVAMIEKQNLLDQFNDFRMMAEAYRTQLEAAGVDVNKMIEAHRTELNNKTTALDQKAFDEGQRYRLEGWKKANDAIIEDQKRVYDAFKDQFSQLFDAFTDKTKSLGQALGDFFKKAVIGEAKELFSSTMAGAATQAAGYGRPEESLQRGGQGILGTLLRRGMPPRPPLPPPPEQGGTAVTGVTFPPLISSLQNTADRNEITASLNANAATVFANAVNTFAGASVSSKGYAGRSADDDGGDAVGAAFQTASQTTGVPQPLLRAVAQAESNMNPLAVSPKGAMGLMQLMPATAAGRGVTDPFNVGQNVMGGAQELQWLLKHYGGDQSKALGAYNFGVGNYDRAIAAGRSLPRETQNYVARVMRIMATSQPDAAAAAEASTSSVTVQQLANLPMATPGVPNLFGLPSGIAGGMPTGGDALTGPSVAELANLPMQSTALRRLAPYLTGLAGAGGLRTGAGGTAGGLPKLPTLSSLGEFFGIYGKGITSAGTIATSPAVGALATMGGMALFSKGMQQRNTAATTIGGGLAGAGYVMSQPGLLASMSEQPGGALGGIGAGVAAGAGLGLFASGFQKGGGAGLAMDIGGGALAGAGIGWMAGGPLGAAIGAAVGAVAGGVTGVVRLFVKTEQERIRAGIKQVYGLDISNQQILKQIQQIVDTKYGGSVTIGIRSQEVQDIVRLYALSTGQAANLPRPMYAATIAQSQAGGLATQPVYQGGVLVQNPYTGPTTYQYQTAVTSAQGLMSGTSQGVPGAGGQVSSIFMQLNPQQANDLFTGRVVQAVQQNPSAIASANASATRSGDSRVTQASNMLEPLTSLS